MSPTNHGLCVLCAAIDSRALLVLLRRTRPFVDVACLCDGTKHRVRMRHPHRHTGCAGYPWQYTTEVQEETRHDMD
jgi:hypothetical protein